MNDMHGHYQPHPLLKNNKEEEKQMKVEEVQAPGQEETKVAETVPPEQPKPEVGPPPEQPKTEEKVDEPGAVRNTPEDHARVKEVLGPPKSIQKEKPRLICPLLGASPCQGKMCGFWIPETSVCAVRQIAIELSIPNKDYQEEENG
jgi:hypothetical protein